MMNGQLLLFACQLLLITGPVRITTVPSGSEIVIDGTSYGDSPVWIDSLNAGEHRISLIPSPRRLWGNQALDTLVVIYEHTDSLLFRLPGTIHITSSPRGCLIMEKDKPIGYTPLTLSRHPNIETIFTASAPDYLPYTWPWQPLPGIRTDIHLNPLESPWNHDVVSPDGHTNRFLYLGIIALTMAGSSILCSHEADRSYERYEETAHPSDISRLYDRAVLLDRCAGIFWVGFQLTIVGGITWWLLE